MATTHTQKHPYHMVQPSPWPMVGSISALTMAMGGIWAMHGGPIWVFALGVTILLITFYGWWRDVVREAENKHDHTEEVAHGLRFGMLLFIASEVMFFFAFFWAFFHATVPFLSKVALHTWPPKDIVPLETWTLPFFNTLILLTSGATVTYAHHAIRLGDRKGTIRGLQLTVLLGLIFTATQGYEYVHATFKMKDGIYGSTFYLATGFHGVHVIIGTCFLIVCLFRAMKGHFTAERHIGFEAAAWYWHFVDVVWLFLFCFIYWWSAAGYNFPAAG